MMKKFRWAFSCLCLVILLSISATSQDIIGSFAIKNLATGLLLRPLDANKKDATAIVGYSATNWKCMTWDFQKISGDTYNLKNLFTQKTFQPRGSEAKEGVTLEQQPLVNTQANQQWEFIPAGKNIFRIRLKGTDLFLTAPRDKAVNSEVMLSKTNNSLFQEWTIYEQHPEI